MLFRSSTNIAMERLKCFVYWELENAVFIDQDDQEQAEMLQLLGINIVTLPDEPIDQIIGIMLFTKLNAIMQDRLSITRLDISSILGDSVWYQHEEDDPLGPFTNEGWWHSSNPQHHDLDVEPAQQNIVKVNPNPWLEYQLLWPEEQVEQSGNTVVFADFSRHENK